MAKILTGSLQALKEGQPDSLEIEARLSRATTELEESTYLGGEILTNGFDYLSLTDYVWFLAGPPTVENKQECIESYELVAFNIAGEVTDRALAHSGEGVVLSGTSWTLSHSPSGVTGGCLQGNVVTSKLLDVPINGSLQLYIHAFDEYGEFVRKAVYLGRCEKPPIPVRTKLENGNYYSQWSYPLNGWKVFCDNIKVINYTASLEDISVHIYNLLTSHLIANYPVKYDPDFIQIANYEVELDVTDSSLTQVFNELTQLAGLFTWGINPEGYFYFRAKQTSPTYHFWPNDSTVELTELEENVENIVNRIYITVDDNGNPVTSTYESAASQAAYGLVEQTLDFPDDLAATQPLQFALHRLHSSRHIANPDSILDGLDTYEIFAEMTAIPGDYIEFLLNSVGRVTGFQIFQGGLDGAGRVEDYDIYDGELLLAEVRGDTTSVTTVLDEYVGSIKVVARSAPTLQSKKWLIREINIFVDGNVRDVKEKYASTFLNLWKKATQQGTIVSKLGCFLEPNCFRVTDVNGKTRNLYVESANYSINTTMEMEANVGINTLDLDKVLTIQSRLKR